MRLCARFWTGNRRDQQEGAEESAQEARRVVQRTDAAIGKGESAPSHVALRWAALQAGRLLARLHIWAHEKADRNEPGKSILQLRVWAVSCVAGMAHTGVSVDRVR